MKNARTTRALPAQMARDSRRMTWGARAAEENNTPLEPGVAMSPLRSRQRSIDIAEAQEREANRDEIARQMAAVERRAAEILASRPAPIDLEAFVRETLAGAVGDDPLPFTSTDAAEEAIIRMLARRCGRPLTAFERGRVGMEVVVQWNARRRASA